MKRSFGLILVPALLLAGLVLSASADQHDAALEASNYFDDNSTVGDFPGTLQCVKGDSGAGCQGGHAVLTTPMGSFSLIIPKSAVAAVKANLGKKVVVNGKFYTDIDTIFVANIEPPR